MKDECGQERVRFLICEATLRMLANILPRHYVHLRREVS